MIERICEPVQVLAAFKNGGIRPRAFIWNGRRYDLEKVNLVYRGRDGRDLIIFFTVSDKNRNAFKLSFRPSLMEWRLLETYASS